MSLLNFFLAEQAHSIEFPKIQARAQTIPRLRNLLFFVGFF